MGITSELLKGQKSTVVGGNTSPAVSPSTGITAQLFATTPAATPKVATTPIKTGGITNDLFNGSKSPQSKPLTYDAINQSINAGGLRLEGANAIKPNQTKLTPQQMQVVSPNTNPLDKGIDNLRNFFSDPNANPVVKAVHDVTKNVIEPIYESNPTLRGIQKGIANTFLGSSHRTAEFFNKPIDNPKDVSGKAQQTVGEVMGTMLSYYAAGSILKFVGAANATMPILFATLGQTSSGPNTTIIQRLEKLPVDVTAGWLFHNVPGADKLFSKQSLKVLGAVTSIASGQTLLNSLIEGLSPKEAAITTAKMAVMAGLFHIAGVGTGLIGKSLTESKFKNGVTEMTPQQARDSVIGTPLEDHPVGKQILKTSLEAEQQGKNLKIDMGAAKKSAVADFLNLDTPSGIKLNSIELVDPKATIAGSTGTENPTAPSTPSGDTLLAKSRIKVPETFKSDTEKGAYDLLQKDPIALRDQYIQKFGNEVNTDNARELFPQYNGTNSIDVQNPAYDLKSIVLDHLIATRKDQGNNTVLVTAGGPGSGKTTAISQSLPNRENYSFILDSTLGGRNSKQDIQHLLDKGFKVHIAYVLRHPVAAWVEGVLNRPRTVTENYHIKTHDRSRQQIVDIYDTFKDNKNVQIDFIDNTGQAVDIKPTTVDFVKNFTYNQNEARSQIYDATDKKKQTGEITAEQHAAFTADRNSAANSGKPEEQSAKAESAANEIRGEIFSENIDTAKQLYDTYSKEHKLPSFEQLVNEVEKEKYDQVQEVRHELYQMESSEPDHSTRTLITIAEKLAKHFKTPKAVFKITGKERTYEAKNGNTLKVGGSAKEAFDRLVFANDIEGFSKSMGVLADQFGGVFSDMYVSIKKGDIDGADYEKFKKAFSEIINNNGAGRGVSRQERIKQDTNEAKKAGNTLIGSAEVILPKKYALTDPIRDQSSTINIIYTGKTDNITAFKPGDLVLNVYEDKGVYRIQKFVDPKKRGALSYALLENLRTGDVTKETASSGSARYVWQKVEESNKLKDLNKDKKVSSIENIAIKKNSPAELAYDLARKLNNFSLGDIKLSKDQKIELQQWDNKYSNIISSRGITAVKEVPTWIKNAWNKSQSSITSNASIDSFQDVPNLTEQNGGAKIIPFPEMVRLARTLLGEYPLVTTKPGRSQGVTVNGMFIPTKDGKIKLNAELFKDVTQAAKTLAHEMGHLTDYLPDKNMKRGNLLGRIASLKKSMVKKYEGLENKVVRKELIALSREWRGDFAVKGGNAHDKYRRKATELYADAISVLFNDPERLRTQAPNFWNGFFEYVDRKPAVKENLFALWDMLNQPESVVQEKRLEDLYSGFKTAKEKRLQIEAEKPPKRPWIESVMMQHITRFDPIYRKLNNISKGLAIELSPKEQVRMQLEEMQMRKNESYLYLDQINKEITNPLEQIGLTDEDLGVIMTLERNLGDRKEKANPYGLQGKYAQETLTYFKEHLKKTKNITDEQFAVLEQVSRRFREIQFEKITAAKDAQLYSEKFYKETALKNKDTYVTYQVVDYIHENYVSAGIKHAVGTLKQIENPFTSSVLKTIAVTEQTEIQKGKLLVVDQLQQNFPDDISKAKAIRPKGVKVGYRKEKNMDHLELYEDGKRVAYNVDPYIKQMFDFYSPTEMHNLVKASGAFNRVFKPVVTTYNLSWGFFSNIARDTSRTYKNLSSILPTIGKKQNISMGEYLVTWFKSIPEGYRYNTGNIDGVLKEMLKNKAMSVPFTSFDPTANEESSIAPILRKYHLMPEIDTKMELFRKQLFKPLIKILKGIEFAGSTLETTSKVAGYQLVRRRVEDARTAGFITRNYVGTPNYVDGGTQKQVDNNIFVFSNIMFQALRTDLELATGPTTRSGWWFKTFLMDVLPKLAMLAAIVGLFGSKVQDMMNKATEYDKTNYIVVPIAEQKNGEAVYMRIPQDETGRLIGAMVWKLGNYMNGTLKKGEQVLALGAGYLPSVTPLFGIAGGWLNYAQGRNPYDSYRGRLVVDDTTWKAGGLPAFMKMIQWTTNELGLSQFTTYSDQTNTTLDNILQYTPIINRAIKSTDYGLKEQEAVLQQGIDKQNAQQTLKSRELLNKYIKKGKEAATANDARALRDQFVKEVLGNPPYKAAEKTKAENLKKKFTIGVVKGTMSRELDSMIDANTNDFKVSLLQLYKQTLSQERYNDLIQTGRKYKIISDDLKKTLKRQKLYTY